MIQIQPDSTPPNYYLKLSLAPGGAEGTMWVSGRVGRPWAVMGKGAWGCVGEGQKRGHLLEEGSVRLNQSWIFRPLCGARFRHSTKSDEHSFRKSGNNRSFYFGRGSRRFTKGIVRCVWGIWV